MPSFNFIFMADCQLGALASFSGMDAEDVVSYAARGMRVEEGPRIDGFEWDAAQYVTAVAADPNSSAVPVFDLLIGP